MEDFRVCMPNTLCNDQLEGPAIENNSFLQGHCNIQATTKEEQYYWELAETS